MLSFSEMYCNTTKQEPETGELSGDCCMCGKTTDKGFKKKFSANFTSAEYISSGDVICPYCKVVVNNSDNLRRTMFLLTEDKFIPFKKDKIKEIVFNLPDKPFYLYLTKTWQRGGWILMNRAGNESNKGELTFLIDYDFVKCSINELKQYTEFIGKLRELKIPKTALETGQLSMYHYNKIQKATSREEARTIQKTLKKHAGTPAYELALYMEG